MTQGVEFKTEYLAKFNDSASKIGTTLVKLIVGTEEEVLFADKTMLCSASAFFDRAFNGGFMEQCNEMRLPEETSLTMQLVLSWIYGRNIYYADGRMIGPAELSQGDILEFFRLFNVADKMLMLPLKQHVCVVIRQWIRTNSFMIEHFLPAAWALADAEELQKLLILEVAVVFSKTVKEQDISSWLMEFLEANPSIAPRALLVQSDLARREMKRMGSWDTLENDTISQMIKECF